MAKKYPKVRERNGKFYYRYDVKDPSTGKRKQKETKGFTSARSAYNEGLRIEEELRKGVYVDEARILVHEWAAKWIELYRNSGRVKNSTIKIREISLKKLVKEIGMIPLKDVTSFQYQEILNKLKNAGFARQTVCNFHAAASMMFQKAVQMKIIQHDPTKQAEIPTYRKTIADLENGNLPKYMEKEELSIFLKAANFGEDNHRYIQFYHLLFILAYTGMRIGELHALKWTDIDYENEQIIVTKTISLLRGVELFELTTPKTTDSIRKIDVSKNVLRFFKMQEKFLNQYKMLRRDEFKDHNFVFVNMGSKPGYPLAVDLTDIHFKKVLQKAGLSNHYTPHSLRHTYTSLMAEAGVPLPTIQKLLGHSSSKITERIYLHVTKSQKKEAADKLESLMSGLL